MAGPFSSLDLSRIARVTGTLLAPLGEGGGLAPWRAAVHDALAELFGARVVSLLLPTGHGLTWHSPLLASDALAAYVGEFQADDFVRARMRGRGVPVSHASMVATRDELRRAGFHNEWVVPNHCADMASLHVGLGRGEVAEAVVCCERAGSGRDPFRDERAAARAVALLETIRPAFEAGAHAAPRFAHRRADLARILDQLGEPLAAFDAAGRVLLHANAAFERLAGAAPWLAAPLRAAIAAAARAVATAGDGAAEDDAAATRAAARDLHLAGTRYRIRTTLTAGVFGTDRAVLVSVERHEPDPLGDEALRARFRLTPRQCAVARLLAAGADNDEVCAALGVTTHTGRRHTEHVLAKLGVRSRAQVGAVLRGEGGRRETGSGRA